MFREGGRYVAGKGGRTVVFLNIYLGGKLSQHFLLRLERVASAIPEKKCILDMPSKHADWSKELQIRFLHRARIIDRRL